MHVRKLAEAEKAAITETPVSDPASAKKFPVLFEYLTVSRYEDGSPRKPSSVLLFVSDGQFKAMLKDPDNARCLWVAAHSLADVFVALEACLSDANAVWRVDRQKPGEQASRIKKGS